MSSNTPNLNLILPERSDYYNSGVHFDNYTTLDSVVGSNQDQITQSISRISSLENVSPVDVKKYGVVADGVTDNTAAINLAFSSNPTASRFHFPAGTILANIKIPRGIVEISGEGKLKTEILAFDDSKATIDCDGKLYIKLSNMSVSAKFSSTSENIINARDCRYLEAINLIVKQNPNTSSEYSYSTIGLDLRNSSGTWTGYNSFTGCRFQRCSYGILYTGPLISMLHLTDCVLSYNKYFGAKIENAEVGRFTNCDVAYNGITSVPSPDTFGGIYFKGKDFTFSDIWFEFNALKAKGELYNDILIHPSSINVDVKSRSIRNISNAIFLSEEEAVNSQVAINNISDDGLGKHSYNNLVRNPYLKYLTTSNFPVEYVSQTASGSSISLISNVDEYIPDNIEKAIKLTSNSAGITNFVQYLIPDSDVAKYAGKTLTVSMWYKLSRTSEADQSPYARIGVNTTNANNYFSTGNYASILNSTDGWRKLVLTLKVSEDNTRLAIGARIAGTTNDSLYICGFSASFGSRLHAIGPGNITEDGGNVLSQEFKIGGKRHGYGNSYPTSKTWAQGDRIYSTVPISNGPEGWVCTVSGTPGTWKEFGSIEN